MKNKFLASLFILSLSLSFVACGNNESISSNTTSQSNVESSTKIETSQVEEKEEILLEEESTSEEVIIKKEPTIIEPLAYDLDKENSLIFASFSLNDLKDALNTKELTFDAYTMDVYDCVDIVSLKEGDIIIVNELYSNSKENKEIIVESIETMDNYISINGGLENEGLEFSPNEEGGTYSIRGWDDYTTYTFKETITLPISDDLILVDDTLLTGDEVSFENIENFIDTDERFQYYLDEEYNYFQNNNTQVLIENGIITKIIKYFNP